MDYRLYRNGVVIYEGPGRNHVDSGVSMGQTYNYFVRAQNALGFRDTDVLSVTPGVTCLVPTGPTISSVTPTSIIVGDGANSFTINGSGWGSTSVRLLVSQTDGSDFYWQNQAPRYTPTSATSTTVTWVDPGTISGTGWNIFYKTGTWYLRVYDGGEVSPTSVTFNVYTPTPAIHSITGGPCRAAFRCDVTANGVGYLNAQAITAGISTSWYINGTLFAEGNAGGAVVTTTRPLVIAGALILTPGSYAIDACNKDYYVGGGTNCDRLYLSVDP